jgi:Fe-S cluster assembly scaffold protein SufB
MKKSKLKQLIKEEIQKALSKTSTIELNTSFLQSQDDFERAGDEGYTVWKSEFKNGLKANQQNFKSSGKSAIPVQRTKFEMIDTMSDEGGDISYINVKFKKSLNEVFIDLDDYDPEEFGVEDFDKFDEIVESKPNPTLQDVSELIDLKNKDLSFYGCYVLDIKSNEIISITKHN